MADLYAFIDESYQRDHYYLAAVVLTPEQFVPLKAGFDAVKAHASEKFGVPGGAELHGHCIMQGRDDWEVLRGQVHEAVAIYRNVMRSIASSGAAVLVEGVDVTRLHARYSYPDPPYEICLRHLLERIDDLTVRQGKTTCAVKADMVPHNAQFRRTVEQYVRAGTPGYRSHHLRHIEQPLTWADSSGSPGLQAADMVVYMYRRAFEPDRNASARSRRAARAIWSEVAGAVRHARKWRP